jgi:hypothetical protein
MYRTCTTAMLAALLIVPPLAVAAEKCPSELAQAKTMLGKATSARTTAQPSQKLAGARTQDIQAPRGQDVQAPRGQDIQAPRAQDIQAPRGQDIQAPRAQDIQAPRGQDIQAPRAQDIQAPRGQTAKAGPNDKASLDTVRKLIQESEAACKKGDMAASSSKAREAMELLK